MKQAGKIAVVASSREEYDYWYRLMDYPANLHCVTTVNDCRGYHFKDVLYLQRWKEGKEANRILGALIVG
jgi:hypothetical protein